MRLFKITILSALIMILGAYHDSDFVFMIKTILFLLFVGYLILSIIMTVIYFPI